MQSDLRPQWERLAERDRDYLLAPPEFKQFQPSFAAGQRLRFRLRANPTKKVASLSKDERLAGAANVTANQNGRRLALLREDEQVAWLLHKGEEGGFRIPGEWVAADDDRRAPNFRVEVIPEGWVRCGKDGHADGRFFAVRFEGVLRRDGPRPVSANRRRRALAPAKGFGFRPSLRGAPSEG